MKKKQFILMIVLIISFLMLTQLPPSLKKAKAINNNLLHQTNCSYTTDYQADLEGFGEGEFTWTFFINKENRGIKNEEAINMLFLTNVTNDNQL